MSKQSLIAPNKLTVCITTPINNPNSFTIYCEGEETKKQFLILLNRALNCWDEAPGEFKALADILQHGAPLQDYGIKLVRRKAE